MSSGDFFEVGSLKRAIDKLDQKAKKQARNPTIEEAEELEALRLKINRTIYGRVRGRWKAEGWRQSDWLSEYLAPTSPELMRMVGQIYRKLGSLRATAILLGTDRHSIRDWVNGYRPMKDTPQMRRLVWLTWALICAPHRIGGSVFNVLTWGRMANGQQVGRVSGQEASSEDAGASEA